MRIQSSYGRTNRHDQEHQKERIVCRIDQQLAAIVAEQTNLTIDGVIESQGLTRPQAELDGAKLQQQIFRQREDQIRRQMLAHMRGVPVDTIKDWTCGHSPDREIEKTFAPRRLVHELVELQYGQPILRFREEQESLLNVVWLAANGSELRTLWSTLPALQRD